MKLSQEQELLLEQSRQAYIIEKLERDGKQMESTNMHDMLDGDIVSDSDEEGPLLA